MLSQWVLSDHAQAAFEKSLVDSGVPALQLMESVASQCAAQIAKLLRGADELWFLVGPGNNGADGLATLRLLSLRHAALVDKLRVVPRLVLWPGRVSGLRAQQERWLLERERGSDYEILRLSESEFTPRALQLASEKGKRLVVDAIFGAGFELRKPLEAKLTDFLKRLQKRPSYIVSIDRVSGVDAQGNADPSFALHADRSLSVSGPKLAQIQGEAVELGGSLQCIDLGFSLDEKFRKTQAADDIPFAFLKGTKSELHALFEARAAKLRRLSRAAHKNTRGRVLVVGGSLAEGGACRLVAESALRGGTGYVTLVTEAPSRNSVYESAREWLLRGRPAKTNDWAKLFASHDVLVFGPGLPAGGLGSRIDSTWASFFEALPEARMRLAVIDGGGLATFADRLKRTELQTPLVFTPHPKEAYDILGMAGGKGLTRFALWQRLEKFFLSENWTGAFCLKGAYPLLSSFASNEENEAFAVNIANPSFATAGSGDALCGVIAAAAHRIEASPHALAELSLISATMAQARVNRKRFKSAPLAGELGRAMAEELHALWKALL